MRAEGNHMKSPLDKEFEPDDVVIVYQNGVKAYEGRWDGRPDEYDGTWYLLRPDVEEANILIIDER